MDKKKFMRLQNFVKDEAPNNARLPSLKLPRDLRLGGTKRKEYAPNLNVARRNKPIEPCKIAEKKNVRNVPNSQRNRRENANGRYIQTAGIFSEGTAEIRRPTRHVDRNISYKERDTVATMVLPKINRNSWTVNKTAEDVVVSDLLADSESGSEEEDAHQPIVLTECKQTDGRSKSLKLEVKQENDTKASLPVSDVRTDDNPEDEKLRINMLNSCFFNCPKYSDETPCVSIITLPDSFAGRGGSDDPDDRNLDYPLSDLLEGQIGRILIRQSGRMEIQIGRVTYDMDAVKNSAFHQEIMSVSKKDDSTQECKVGNLGKVQEQYILMPVWPKLAKDPC